MGQEVTTNSWGSRIVGAFWGVLIGIALIVGSLFLIFWNEGNGLHTAQSLHQAQEVLVHVPIAPIDAANNLRVVHFSGLAEPHAQLHDSLLGIDVKAIKLARQVEMYQWKEETDTQTESQVGGSEKQVKTYSYKQVWSDSFIDSSEFHEQTGHQNPSRMSINSKEEVASLVTVGDYHLSKDLIAQVDGYVPLDISQVNIDALHKKLNRPVLLDGNNFYVGTDPELPKIGDMRLSLTQIVPQVVSVIAQQNGHALQAFNAPAGREVSLLAMGEVSSGQMILDAESANKILTWILRVVSLAMGIFGFIFVLRPLSVLADVIPFLGSIVGLGTGLIGFVCGVGLWATVTAIAWFTVRPLWSIALIAIVVAVFYALYHRKKQTQVSSK